MSLVPTVQAAAAPIQTKPHERPDDVIIADVVGVPDLSTTDLRHRCTKGPYLHRRPHRPTKR